MNNANTTTLPFKPGSGISGIGGAIVALLFFMPWFSACGVNVSGKDLAFGIDTGLGGSQSSLLATYPWLALVPLCGIVAVLLSLLSLGLSTGPTERLKALGLLGLGGLAALLLGIVFLGYVNQTSNAASVVIKVEYGLPGAMIGAVMVVAGGLLNLVTSAGRQAPQQDYKRPPYEGSPQPYNPPATYPPPPLPSPTPRRRAWLHGKAGTLAGQAFEITSDRFKVGRSSENELHVPDPAASRLHAVIRYAQGRYFLQDQQSAHGTLVNGQPTQAIALNDGDIIGIGDTTMQFRVQ